MRQFRLADVALSGEESTWLPLLGKRTLILRGTWTDAAGRSMVPAEITLTDAERNEVARVLIRAAQEEGQRT